MNPSRRAGIAVFVLLCVGNILSAQEQNNRRGRDNSLEARLLNNIFRAPRRVTSTDQQKANLKALREKHGTQLATKLLEIQKKLNAVYTREQSATRRQVRLEPTATCR